MKLSASRLQAFNLAVAVGAGPVKLKPPRIGVSSVAVLVKF